MFGLGTTELLIFAVVVLVLFGSRLPKVMRSLGSSVTEFKKGVNEGEETEENSTDAAKPASEPHVEAKS